MIELANYLKLVKSKKIKSIDFFCDIETFQYNMYVGKLSPKKYKNQVFSFAAAYIHEGEINIFKSPTFMEFFDIIESAKLYVSTKINLYFHNGNKYDNHYLLSFLESHYDIKRYPMFLKNALDNTDAGTFKQLSVKKGDKVIFEKRLKSETNLELKFTLGSVKYETIDTFPKINMSLKTAGEKLARLGIIGSDRLKTSFDYTKYNQYIDLSQSDAEKYAREIHEHLSDKENQYIDNDVFLLAMIWKNYNAIFPGFDQEKITFSSNVLDEYLLNNVANAQLKNKFGDAEIKYSDYDINGVNFGDYLRRFFKGGLNVYNDAFIGEIITGGVNSYDLNSSFPAVMYNDLIPTIMTDVKNGEHELTPDLSDEIFETYEVTINEFNRLIDTIDSEMIRKSLIKYYSNMDDNVYINTNTIRIIMLFNGNSLPNVKSLVTTTWHCEPFGAREVINFNYKIKTQGRSDKELIYNSPIDIIVTDKQNTSQYSEEEIYNSKVVLNSIYGLPAMRPYYDLFKYDPIGDVIVSRPNGYKNTERNVMFSAFVTSKAVFNLLKPLHTLSSEEIDDNFLYADTDSIYVKSAVGEKIDKTNFDNLKLGYFKNEHQASKFFVLNHKKYVFETFDGKLHVVSGGIPASSFNTDMTFDEFIDSQFHDGSVINVQKNVLTDMNTIAIYNSKTELEKGVIYQNTMSQFQKDVLKRIAENAKDVIMKSADDMTGMFIDTPFGTLSLNDIMGGVYDSSDRDVLNLIRAYALLKRRVGL